MNIKAVKRYYNNLNYDPIQNRENEMNKIINNVIIVGGTLVPRIVAIAVTIKDNIDIFRSFCNHVDIPNAINEYLKSYPEKLPSDYGLTVKESVITLVLTLFTFCASDQIQSYFEAAILPSFVPKNDYQYREYKSLLSRQIIDVIILYDSDLYAFFGNLKRSENCRYLNKIWVSNSIKHNFLSLRNSYFPSLNNYTIHIFKYMEELLTPPVYYTINVTSIWSENVTTARRFAASLNRNIILMNTLDYYDTMLVMPYVEVFTLPVPRQWELNKTQYIINSIELIESNSNVPRERRPENPTYILMFYDSTWHLPVRENYWRTDKNKATLIANASSEDVIKCVISARKGFKIWSEWPTEIRMQALSKLAFTLKHKNKNKCAAAVSKWLKYPYWYMSSMLSQSERSMLIRSRKPKGVITLMDKSVPDLFRKLTQSIIVGNSVIVLYTHNSCDISEYCDMFVSSGIPPGVINLLPCKSVKLKNTYPNTTLESTYLQCTTSKQIALTTLE